MYEVVICVYRHIVGHFEGNVLQVQTADLDQMNLRERADVLVFSFKIIL